MRTELKLQLAFVAALLIMAMNAAVPFISIVWTQQHQEELRHSQEEIEFVGNLISLIKDAETGQRGFIITGNEAFLDPYHIAIARLDSMLPQLPQFGRIDPSEREPLQRLERSAALKLEDMAASIALRRSQGFEPAQSSIQTGRGKAYMEQVRQAADELIRMENTRREVLRLELNQRVKRSAYLGTAATILDILLIGIALFYLFRTLKERQEIAQSFRLSGERLNLGMQELERRNREISLIGQMARALESQITLKEAFGIISVFYSKLLPGTSGVLYLFRNSGDLLEKEAEWGTPRVADACILPDSCWALRRGQPHVPPHSSDLPCPHAGHDAYDPRICLPLMAQGEVLGLIIIETAGADDMVDGTLDPRVSDLAVSISEQVALALSNARLRKVLREQSIMDPLTGMFNRRYMEETLRREIARAQRMSAPLSVIVMDVDHFKRINDTVGHEAGDMVLQALAQQVRRIVRESDAACRFGGEEFVLILPDCDKAAAIEKANQIATALRAMDLRHQGNALDTVTASLGVASYPEDGATSETLVQAADQAMYFGKKNGRDRVVAAGTNPALAA